jgi:hypothetical protein
VPLGECASRAGLEIALEAERLLFRPEFNRDGDRPWTVCRGVSARPIVVPGQARSWIISQAYGVTAFARYSQTFEVALL